MKPGLETAIREHLELFDDEGTPKRDVIWAVFRSTVLRLRSEFKIETGNSGTVDIPVTDGKECAGYPICDGDLEAMPHDEGCPLYIPVRDGEK
jgi:hypothetical protein